MGFLDENFWKEMGWTVQDFRDLCLPQLVECPKCRMWNNSYEEECVTCGELLVVETWEYEPEYCPCCGSEL